MEQDLPTRPEQLSSTPVFSRVPVTRSLVLCVYFVDRFLSFCLYFLVIVLSVFLRFTDSYYPFGIFKLFLGKIMMCNNRTRIFSVEHHFIEMYFLPRCRFKGCSMSIYSNIFVICRLKFLKINFTLI